MGTVHEAPYTLVDPDARVGFPRWDTLNETLLEGEE